jgi:regulator of protease activity HflC (stomatin/prohibitin superfamily)
MIFSHVIKQYERAVVFKLGKVTGQARGSELIFIAPFLQRIHRVSLRIITLPPDIATASTNGELVPHDHH